MTPYSRFRLVSNFLAAAVVAGGLCALWPVASDMIAAATGGLTIAYWGGVSLAALLTVCVSLLMTEALFPALFHWSVLRKMVLGRDYIEGTWLQAERGPAGSERLTVLHVRPAGFGYDLSGYSLNQENEIESNRMVAWTKLDGPVLNYAYRMLMPDAGGNQNQFFSELMFEQRRGAPKALAGYGAPAGGTRRFQIEGVKLTKWSERRRLRKLEQRGEVVAKYWDLFFGVVADAEASPAIPAVHRPVVVVADTPRTPFIERRNPDNLPGDGPVVARRRASDWRTGDTTPTADRIRARMMADLEETAEEEDLYEEETEEDIVYETGEDIEDEELTLEDEDLEAGDEEDAFEAEEDEAYDAEEDEGVETEEDEEFEAEEEDEIVAEDAGEADAEPAPAPTDEEPRIPQRYARR